MADSVDKLAMQMQGENWFYQSEKWRSGLRRLWDREQYKRERENGPLWIRPEVHSELEAFAGHLVEYLRRSMLAQYYNDMNYYPPCWGHDAYDQPASDSPAESSGSETASETSTCESAGRTCPGTSRPREPSRSRTPTRRTKDADKMNEDKTDETDDLNLVQKKWLLKARKPKTPYQSSKMIWQSARPEHRTASTRALRPSAPRSLLARRCASAPWRHTAEEEADTEDVEVEVVEERGRASTRDAAPEAEMAEQEADTAEGLWLILLGLDPYGGALNVPADLTEMPMTLPTEIVNNVRETLSEHTAEEVEEMRAALPNVMDSIREELVGLLDEAAQTRGSSSRPTTMETEAVEVEPDEEEVTQLMQRTVTGMLRTSKQGQGIREDKLALHQELQDFPPGTASHLARRLRARLTVEPQRIDDWLAIEAVLAANAEPKATCPMGEEMAAHSEWIDRWVQRLLRRPRAGQASSSTEGAPLVTVPGNETQLYEDREKEEGAQEQADMELYAWHQKKKAEEEAAEAKVADEVTMQAHLGMSTRRPRKKVRLTVSVQQGHAEHYSEFEVHEGEEIKLGISMTESAPGHYLGGKPISSTEAKEHLLKEEERLRAGRRMRASTTFNMDDPATNSLYQKWIRGQVHADEVAAFGGHDLVKFYEAIRDIEKADVLPATQMETYEPLQGGQGQGQQTLANTIRYNYLGESWKHIMAEQGFRSAYKEWMEGGIGDDMVVLKYGDGAVALFRFLLEHGHKYVPSPLECGSDTDSDTIPFQPTAPVGPDEQETLILSGSYGGEGRLVTSESNEQSERRPTGREDVQEPDS